MKKIIAIVLLVGLAVGGYIGYPYYKYYQIKDQSILTVEQGNVTIEIEEDIKFKKLGTYLEKKGVISSAGDFKSLVKVKGLGDEVMSSGKKIIDGSWDNRTLINNLFLKKDEDKSIQKVTITNIRNLKDLAGSIGRQTELDSLEVYQYLSQGELADHFGFEELTFPTMFLPNTYEVYNDVSIEELVGKMAQEYKSFWNADRVQKAKNLGLSQSEVSILASIVYEEQKTKFDEHAKIAGLYLNRLKKNWNLQADPTVKFAVGDMGIKRVLYEHLEFDSPYNTYMYGGLPPGPLNIPEPRVIDAVLDYERHEFMFMCAKPEYSGYHNFAKTNAQHDAYANQYRRWLDKEGIR